MTKEFNIDTDKSKVFKQYIAFISPLLGANSPTERERDVLAEVMKRNYKYSSVFKKDRGDLVLGTKARKEIIKTLGINQNKLNIIIYSLRKKGLLNQDLVNPGIEIFPKDVVTLKLNLKIEDQAR